MESNGKILDFEAIKIPELPFAAGVCEIITELNEFTDKGIVYVGSKLKGAHNEGKIVFEGSIKECEYVTQELRFKILRELHRR